MFRRAPLLIAVFARLLLPSGARAAWAAGPAGATGATGAAGATGATGPAGPAGRDAVVTCHLSPGRCVLR